MHDGTAERNQKYFIQTIWRIAVLESTDFNIFPRYKIAFYTQQFSKLTTLTQCWSAQMSILALRDMEAITSNRPLWRIMRMRRAIRQNFLTCFSPPPPSHDIIWKVKSRCRKSIVTQAAAAAGLLCCRATEDGHFTIEEETKTGFTFLL